MLRNMAIGTCWALLLLWAMFPLQTIAGRHLSAASSATLVQIPPVQVPGEVGGSSILEDVTQFQGKSSPHGDFIHGHRLLVGSSVPTCLGKCGQCNPCSPIHMAVGGPHDHSHGSLTEQEYYPEVWRCKCGGVYFMP